MFVVAWVSLTEDNMRGPAPQELQVLDPQHEDTSPHCPLQSTLTHSTYSAEECPSPLACL